MYQLQPLPQQIDPTFSTIFSPSEDPPLLRAQAEENRGLATQQGFSVDNLEYAVSGPDPIQDNLEQGKVNEPTRQVIVEDEHEVTQCLRIYNPSSLRRHSTL